MCHTDSLLVNGELPNLTYPRVPGHEVIGRIDAVGTNVTSRSVGQRVGVGICGGWDDKCLSCLRGDFVNCANAVLTGIMIDGMGGSNNGNANSNGSHGIFIENSSNLTIKHYNTNSNGGNAAQAVERSDPLRMLHLPNTQPFQAPDRR